MVISKKWKMVGGTVSAAVLFGSGIAGAGVEDAPGRIALDDRVQMADAATFTVESVGTSLQATLRQIAESEDADSLSSPFDGDDEPTAQDPLQAAESVRPVPDASPTAPGSSSSPPKAPRLTPDPSSAPLAASAI